MKLCPLSEECRDFTTGNNKPPNHHIRTTEPCKSWLDMSCEAIPYIYKKVKGEYPACKINVREKFK